MKKLALIGKDVSKSTSPEIHAFIAQRMGNGITYDKLSILETQFEKAIAGILNEYDGLNVTIPYKLSIIPHLSKIVGDAKAFGAVNTVCTAEKSGYNTDGLGFELMLSSNGVSVRDKEVLVLGAGGAGRSVAKKLLDGGAKVSIYDKNFHSAEAVSEEFGNIAALEELIVKPYYAIINATGIGMHKTEGTSPVGDDFIKLCCVAVDLIYVPAKSRFLEIAESFGKKIINGGGMLFYQAYYSQCIYFGLTPDEEQAKKLYAQYTEEI